VVRRVCDLETSRVGAPYIYDISNLRVNLNCMNEDDGFINRNSILTFPWCD